MPVTSERSGYKVGSLWIVIKNLGIIAAGSLLCAVAINGILIPHKLLNAGFSGLALIVHYLSPGLPVDWLYFLLNVPLFIIGWKYVGRRFFLYSLAGMVIFSLAIRWVHFPIAVEDRILSSLLAGIISGCGAGIILRSLGSAGGLDILSVIMLQKFSFRLGSTSLGFNSLLLIAGGFLFSVEIALYTLIYVFVTSRIIDLVVTGLSQRKAVILISSRWDELSKEILHNIHRGVTLLEGHGGYSGKEERVIYTVVTFQELPRLKDAIKRLDPQAFMVVSDTLEVMGRRIGTQPHW